MPSFLRASITALALAVFSSTAGAINPGFPYGSTKVRGVNLGGWLVLEVRASRTLSITLGLLTRAFAFSHGLRPPSLKRRVTMG